MESIIEKIAKEQPDAFVNPTVVEDANFLRPFGIFIPNKEKFPLGLIKHFPEDFIVEEVQVDGSVTDITVSATKIPLGNGPFIRATLVKCGISTLEAIEDLSRALGCQKADIGYSGIKDKEAITAQRITIRNVAIEKIVGLKLPNIFLKDLEFTDKPAQKGVIKGNRFTLYIRTEQAFFNEDTSREFVARLNEIKQKGFYNFYYLQRFGMPRLVNIPVGLHIMRGDYDKAIHTLLTGPSELENPFMRETRAKLTKSFGNWAECYEIIKDFPQLFRDELTIVNYMIKKPDHWTGAWQQLLDKVSINVYSIPSLFFNEYISTKLEAGMEVPRELPLLLSDDQRDMDLYKDMLKNIGLYPFTGRCLRPFSIIRFMKRMVPTRDIPELHGASVTDEGVVLSFTLGKGQYATTFLSHLFNLVSGQAPAFATSKTINSKEAIGTGDMAPTLTRFAETIRSKRVFRDLGAGSSD